MDRQVTAAVLWTINGVSVTQLLRLAQWLICGGSSLAWFTSGLAIIT
jgi:hypothetical protein